MRNNPMVVLLGLILLSFLFAPTLCSGQEEQIDEDPIDRMRLETPVEATSLLGQPLKRPEFEKKRFAKLYRDLVAAVNRAKQNPSDVEKLIWVGRRMAYLWRYQESIEAYSAAIDAHPNNPRTYRHRGHRYITIRKLDLAIADLKRAAELIDGTEDEVEEDGMPNDAGIPTSTLHTNIWYHLGLAYYLKGDYEKALAAYKQCLAAAKNDDMQVATLDWMYMTLRRMGEDEQAKKLLTLVDEDMQIIENHAYHRRLLMYKGKLKPDDLISEEGSESYDLDLATYGYGIGNWQWVNGDKEAAMMTFNKVIKGKYWSAFGFIAAEADLARSTPNH